MRRLVRMSVTGRLIAYYWHLRAHHIRAEKYWTHREREATENCYRHLAQNATRRCVWSLEQIEVAERMLDTFYPRWRCHLPEEEEDSPDG